MKIGANISTYYRSQSQTSSSGPAILASTSESASQRTQAPTISIGGTSASTALSSALWLSIAGKSSEEASALFPVPRTKASPTNSWSGRK